MQISEHFSVSLQSKGLAQGLAVSGRFLHWSNLVELWNMLYRWRLVCGYVWLTCALSCPVTSASPSLTVFGLHFPGLLALPGKRGSGFEPSVMHFAINMCYSRIPQELHLASDLLSCRCPYYLAFNGCRPSLEFGFSFLHFTEERPLFSFY